MGEGKQRGRGESWSLFGPLLICHLAISTPPTPIDRERALLEPGLVPAQAEPVPGWPEPVPSQPEPVPNGVAHAPRHSEHAPRHRERAPPDPERAPSGSERAPAETEGSRVRGQGRGDGVARRGGRAPVSASPRPPVRIVACSPA